MLRTGGATNANGSRRSLQQIFFLAFTNGLFLSKVSLVSIFACLETALVHATYCFLELLRHGLISNRLNKTNRARLCLFVTKLVYVKSANL